VRRECQFTDKALLRALGFQLCFRGDLFRALERHCLNFRSLSSTSPRTIVLEGANQAGPLRQHSRRRVGMNGKPCASSRRIRAVYWNNIPSPYTVERLNEVARRGNVELEVWFTSRTHRDRSWEVDETTWEFPFRYLHGLSVPLRRGGSQFELRSPLVVGRSRPDLLVSLYAEPVYLAGWTFARTLGIRTAFRVLPTYDSWVRRSPAKEAAKRYIFARVDGVKVPGPDGAAYAQKYGVPRERIHSVTQSIDVDRFRNARHRWLPERDALRAQLGVDGCVFLYVGRLVDGKGLRTLLDAYRLVARGASRVSLLLVGDGADEAEYRRLAERRGLPNVRFGGFVQQADIPRVYAVADVFVFPTLGDPNGVVVEEAMASSLPVIASAAAGDIKVRVPEGRAGFVVPPANAIELADRMTRLAAAEELRRRFAAVAQEHVAGKSHARYAQDFEQFVEDVVGASSRSGRAGHSVSRSRTTCGRALRGEASDNA
jgi:glycosyltransferase involved in cell wall biosynthesis